jgi:hypothetical protein
MHGMDFSKRPPLKQAKKEVTVMDQFEHLREMQGLSIFAKSVITHGIISK